MSLRVRRLSEASSSRSIHRIGDDNEFYSIYQSGKRIWAKFACLDWLLYARATLYARLLCVSALKVGGSGVRLNDGPDIKLFILVGLGRSFFVCCLAHRGSTVGFLLLQCSSGVVRHPRDLQVSVATHFCRVLIFASS